MKKKSNGKVDKQGGEWFWCHSSCVITWNDVECLDSSASGHDLSDSLSVKAAPGLLLQMRGQWVEVQCRR